MGIVNRSLDASEQKDLYCQVFAGTSGVIASGTTLIVGPIASAGTIDRVAVTCQGASVSPTSSIQVLRFIPGAGATTISALGSSFVLPAMGVSGYLSVSLVAAGSTLLSVLPGDCIQMILGVNSAVCPAIDVVVKKTQEIVSRFGSQT